MGTFSLVRAAAMVGIINLVLPLQPLFSRSIERVDVEVYDANGGTSAPLLAKMAGSMEIVAQQLLLDKETDAVAGEREAYQALFREIADRVFSGYETAAVELNVEPGAQLVFYLRPWSGVIADADIDIRFSGLDGEVAALLEQKLPGLRQRLAATINGASRDVGDCAGGILRRLVREEVEAQLPEFKAAVDLTQDGEKTAVQVIIYPLGPLVSDIRYEMRSQSIPNIMLMELKYKYRQYCDRFRGLPVDYIKQHKEELEEQLLGALLKEREVKDYGLTPTVKLTPGSTLDVELLMNSKEYRLYFEGYGDIGRENENLSGKAHLGKMIGPEDEIFGEAEVTLDEVHWRYGLGYARLWGKSSWSYMRRTPTGDNVYKLEYGLGPKWILRAQHFSRNDRNEYGVRYRVHEFLSLEGVYGGDEFYLRLIGNL